MRPRLTRSSVQLTLLLTEEENVTSALRQLKLCEFSQRHNKASPLPERSVLDRAVSVAVTSSRPK